MRWPVHLFDFGYYGPGSISWKVNREWAVMLGGTRAVLMQLAHPLVALGVSNHSSYMTDPFGRGARTFVLGEKLIFGPSRTARQAARTINNLHKHVHVHLPTDAGAFAQGAPYDARALTHVEEEQYYRESKTMARQLGLTEEKMPAGIDDLKQYVYSMVHSDHLAPTLQARELAHQTLFPPAPIKLRPLMHLNLNITNALLPQPVREIFNLEWSKNQQRAFELAAHGSRLVIPRLPASWRELPLTSRMMRGELRQPA